MPPDGQGQFDLLTGARSESFSEIARIDPSASSGRFTGATGVLFTSGKTTDGGATFESRIPARSAWRMVALRMATIMMPSRSPAS